MDADVKPGDDVARATLSGALRNLAFPEGVKAYFGDYGSCLLLLLSLGATYFPCCGITGELAELQVHGKGFRPQVVQVASCVMV